MIKPEESVTLIGRTTRLRGEIHCASDLKIEGDFEGAIWQTDGHLTVGAEAHVRGNISAQDVLIYGNVEGDIRAKGRVDLRSSAVVLGDIFASRISMEEDAILRGEVDPSRAGEESPLVKKDASPLYLLHQATEFPEHVESAPLQAQQDAPVAVSQRSLVAAPVLTQSGRQLPAALAAFAVGTRQDTASETEAYSKESSHKDEDVPWRNRSAEE